MFKRNNNCIIIYDFMRMHRFALTLHFIYSLNCEVHEIRITSASYSHKSISYWLAKGHQLITHLTLSKQMFSLLWNQQVYVLTNQPTHQKDKKNPLNFLFNFYLNNIIFKKSKVLKRIFV